MKKTYTFPVLPQNATELVIDRQDPFGVAALCVAALCAFPADREASYAMIDALKGPQPLSPMDKAFIRDRFLDKDYVPRSYFDGARPDNNYTPAQPYTISVEDNPYSRDAIGEGYLTLYVRSGGADSPRPIRLREKKSTGEWFLWDFPGVLAGIRIPAQEDPWA